MKIVNIQSKLFIGKRLNMSLVKDNTFELWHSFMPNLKKIEGRIGIELYSIITYPAKYFGSFSPEFEFEKWAAVEVDRNQPRIEGFEYLEFPAGKYARFIHVGSMDKFKNSMFEIYSKTIPNSGYDFDKRPHIAIMGERYNPQSEFSEEEILVPIR
jgi:AraC family transcriptional regulator